MMYYPIDLYELAREHQNQLRKEAQQDRLARQGAAAADEAEHIEEMLSRGGSVLKAKGKVKPAHAAYRHGSTTVPGQVCPQPKGAQRSH